MMRILVSILFLVTCCQAFSSDKIDALVRKDYKSNLISVLKNIDRETSLKQIEYVIPESNEEALIYFSMDYDESLKKRFSILQSKVVNLCINKKQRLLSKYLILSQFVDGYFAEDYFDNIEKIASTKRSSFCEVLSSINKLKVIRLKGFQSKYCR